MCEKVRGRSCKCTLSVCQLVGPRVLTCIAPTCTLQDGFVLHPDLLNPRLLEAQYAVRGELYLKAEELKKTRDIIYTNGERGGGVDTSSSSPTDSSALLGTRMEESAC